MDKYKVAYNGHKSGAKRRGVPFLLTFEEWLYIWDKSRHWEDRGNRGGQYGMARFGDIGPYAVGNVEIITCNENMRRKESVKGSKQIQSKLTEKIVIRLRKEYLKGSANRGLNVLSIKYNVSMRTIWMAVNRRTWKHV